jgi:tetratricopeptide (TPR) repeat protein
MIAISGCSRKKDKFINRNWHAVTTEYNTLYNGNLALDRGKDQIASSYRENFWELLPVERMQVSEEIRAPGAERNEDFQIAEEKATKAIQRHSMLIQGKERNPQIDEAHLLLGKARYYDERFIPALEAFNYILHKYPASNTISHAQIWREKTHMRMENDRLAIKNLKRLIESGRLEKQDKADAHAVLAQAYINLGAVDSAVVPIRTAALHTTRNKEKARYHYIEGQLYNMLQKRDSANLAFDRVIDLNRRIPREFLVNARLEKIRNFDFSTGNRHELLAKLREMEEDRENRPYLDKIYFQLAEYYKFLDSTNVAIENYNKSLRETSGDRFLQSVNYETLGNIYFDNSQYRTAGTYYDSTLTRIPNTTRDYFVVKRKRDNLQEVIQYEDIVEKNDSILGLVAMSEPRRQDYFIKYTNELKERAIEEARRGVPAEAPAVPQGPVIRSPGGPPTLGGPNTSSNFYFYNPARVNTGMQEFLRQWGPRELKDNWRTDPGNISSGGERQLDEVSELIIANNPKFNPQTYIEQIPKDPEVIDSLEAQRNNAYYRLGLIYKEKFSEGELAKEKLLSLLEFTSEERMVLPASYYLYQIFQEEGNMAMANRYRDKVLQDYPDSRYATRILNPGTAVELEDSAEIKYKQMYSLFEAGEFQAVILLGEEYRDEFNDHELLPKIELLHATATGRLFGFDAYREALRQVAVNYPQTEEGARARELVDKALPKMSQNNFKDSPGKVKMLYSYPYGEREEAMNLKQQIDTALEELNYKNYHTSLDVYNVDTIFVVIHGIENVERAGGFGELLRVNKDYGIIKTPVVISSENYRIVQLHKNLDAYLNRNSNP